MNKMNNTYLKNPLLDGSTYIYEGSNIGILLIHGFTATTTEVKPLARHFSTKNYSIYAPLLPGHGTSAGDLNKVKFTDWTLCVDQAFHTLRSKCRQVYIAGESMGGVLSLFLAEKYQHISGIFLFSPALLVNRLKYAKFIKYFKPIMDKGLPDDDLPWQGYTVYPMFAADQFRKLTKMVKKSLHKITTPTLLFQGKFDTSIDKENINFIYSHIKSDIKKKVRLNNSGHVMLLDNEISTITSEIDKFIDDLHIL